MFWTTERAFQHAVCSEKMTNICCFVSHNIVKSLQDPKREFGENFASKEDSNEEAAADIRQGRS